MLTAERLRDRLNYDPATGVFTWRKPLRRRNVGDAAGGPTEKGYVRIGIDGRMYMAHRLAWLHVHGSWPSGQLDHRNTIRSDNSIGNLRLATSAQNSANRSETHNSTGFKGVKRKRGKFEATFRKTYIGTFGTAEEAHRAYASAALSHFGEFAHQ